MDVHVSGFRNRGLVAAVFAFPSLPALFDEQDDDCQGRKAINPPPARHEKLDQQSKNHNPGQIAACDRLDGIGTERPAADLIGDPQLYLGEPLHDGGRQHGDHQARQRELLTLSHPQPVSGTDNDVSRQRE